MAHADLSGRNKFWGNCHARPAPSTKNILGKFMTNDKRNIIMDRIIINQWSVISIQWTYEGWSIRATKKKSFIFVWLIALNQLKSHICFLYEYRKTAETVWSTQHKCCILAMKHWCNDTPTDLCKTLIPLMSIKCTYSSTVESAMLLVARYIYYV